MYVLEFAGEDDRFAAREAATAASDVTPVGAGLATARGIDGLERLAFTRRAARLVGRTDADVESARTLLEAATVDRSGTVAVRARDVRSTTGVDTRRAERVLGSVLVERGFAVDLEDPDHELRALFAADVEDARSSVDDREQGGPLGGDPALGGSTTFEDDDSPASRGDPDGVCVLGWLAGEARRDFADDPTDRPFFQPGSMDPPLARALANLAGAREGRRICDPMCGTGGLLVEASRVGSDVVGVDAQAKMARGARENLAAYCPDARWETARADATRLPLADGAVDGVVFDAPYGRQSKIEGRDLESLVGDALREARRVAGRDGVARAVVVGDRPWDDATREAGWTVESAHRRRVHRSLVRHVMVLR